MNAAKACCVSLHRAVRPRRPSSWRRGYGVAEGRVCGRPTRGHRHHGRSLMLVAILAAPIDVDAQTEDPSGTTSYLLGAVLEGPAEARVRARDELRPPVSNFPPPMRLGNNIVPVATVSSRPSAWSWVVRALGMAPAEGMGLDAPLTPSANGAIAGEQSLRSGATVRAVSVHTLATGPQEVSATPLPLSRLFGATPRPARIARPLASRSFVSASPQPFLSAPTTATVEISASADMVVLGYVDRCVPAKAAPPAPVPEATAHTSCLRWVRVIAEDGGLLLAGVLPAFQVVTTRGWSCDRNDSCAQLSYVGRDGGDALFQVLVSSSTEEVQWAAVRVPAPPGVVPALSTLTSRGRVSLTRDNGSSIDVPLPTFAKVPRPSPPTSAQCSD